MENEEFSFDNFGINCVTCVIDTNLEEFNHKLNKEIQYLKYKAEHKIKDVKFIFKEKVFIAEILSLGEVTLYRGF